MKYKRILLKLSGENFSDKQIEEFVNKFKATIDSAEGNSFDRFETVSGADILKYYNINNYEDFDEGQLGHSCLNNKRGEN
jgi:uridylate kinase